MDHIDWHNIGEELKRCHPALMKVWDDYRDQMHRRGFNTSVVLHNLSAKVWEKHDQYHGMTRGTFCAWALRIMRNSILEELRRRRHEQIDSVHDPIDPDQQRPSEELQKASEELQKGLRLEALEFARDALPEHQRVLIELRIVSELSVRKLGERLEHDYPQLWQIHHLEWSTDARLRRACELAREALAKNFAMIYPLVEGGPTDENSLER